MRSGQRLASRAYWHSSTATACWPGVPALGRGGRSGLRRQGAGRAAQLPGVQKSPSAAGQGPKQDGRRLGRGAPAVFR